MRVFYSKMYFSDMFSKMFLENIFNIHFLKNYMGPVGSLGIQLGPAGMIWDELGLGKLRN